MGQNLEQGQNKMKREVNLFTYNSEQWNGSWQKLVWERWVWKHRYMVQGREGTGSYGLSMSRSIMPTLVIPHAGASPHKWVKWKKNKSLIHNVAHTAWQEHNRVAFPPKTLLLGTKSTNIPNIDCQRTSEKVTAELQLLKHHISKVGEIVPSVKCLPHKHEVLSSICRRQSCMSWDTFVIPALGRQAGGSPELNGQPPSLVRTTGLSEKTSL